ncbi:hypothetical protein ACMX25_40020 [Caballeronia sp. 15715]|uniref:hypothetical protein n=1 Tax=Caballeronia sp. 15715 TaxID=3391030 RepID=UPI0039E459F4
MRTLLHLVNSILPVLSAFASGLIAGGARCVKCSFRFAASSAFELANSASSSGGCGHADDLQRIGKAA